MLRFAFNFTLSMVVLGLISLAVVLLYVIPDLPEIDTLRDVHLQVPLRIYSQDGSLISEYGEKRRTPVSIDDVPVTLIQAFLAAEDDRFYEHPGVDWQGILRAVVNLVKTGEKSQGGSTITMQVARNFFLSREKSYLRKLNEIFLSFKIESELSKDEILELYLNKIYLGQRAYGVAAAAQVYYGSDINDLSLAQAALIAGLPKAPSTTNPVSAPDRAQNRRNYVLRRMLDQGYIDNSEFDQARAAPITASLHSPDIQVEAPYVAEMVRKFLTEEFGEEAYSNGYKVYTTIKDKNQTAANHGLRHALLGYDLRHGYKGAEYHHELSEEAKDENWKQLLSAYPAIGELYPGLVVEIYEQSISVFVSGIGIITIEWPGMSWARKHISENHRGKAPKIAADVVEIGDVIRIIEDDEGQWRLSQIPEVEGGLVSMDPNNGATLALVGGFDFQRSKFNRVTQAFRQPGSNFKPFIYSAALEKGFTAASTINDAPIVFDDPGIEDIWRPENYSGKAFGPTRLREALIRSRNLISIRLLNAINIPYALEHIAKFGFNTSELPGNLSLALGSGAISPWQLAGAYCILANGGFKVDPHFIDRIESYDGEIIFKAQASEVCRECTEETQLADAEESETRLATASTRDIPTRIAPQVISPRNIWIMQSIMRDVIQHGTGRKARSLKRKDLAGKTGTTNDQRDAWFSGFNSSIVAISWVGFDKFQPLGNAETGARAALPMWIKYMEVALEDVPEVSLDPPPGLLNIRINKKSGLPAKSDDLDAFFEIFRVEHAPKPGDFEEESNPYNPGNQDIVAPDLF
ncbi:MAG: PBP1A family penicillin-binding protein [Gammaproteobacteria bacterium]|nr:PBP1A family penicillin-binding protein [Gammaproteobacteria bacterium]